MVNLLFSKGPVLHQFLSFSPSEIGLNEQLHITNLHTCILEEMGGKKILNQNRKIKLPSSNWKKEP